MDQIMQMLLEDAAKAGAKGEVPVAAAIVDSSGKVIARAANQTESAHDPTAHAELLAIRDACHKLGETRLTNCDLIVTLEPCAMCAAAISHARLRRVYFGAYDPKGGAIEHGPKWFSQPTCLHRPEVYGGIHEAECGQLLKDFFRELR